MAIISSVLLVDDDAAANFINQLLLKDVVASGNLQVVQNGEEALQLINTCIEEKRALPELILLDLNMPVMDGFEFLEAYQELDLQEQQKPVIAVLTTSMNPKDVNRINELGIVDFINKPLSPKSIHQLIEKRFAERLMGEF
ncbi:response regulator receiver [Flammeovirgaceae bacterium 311]|nr:response regulator receiver [Flammeovirgaceae bacterium 311]